VTAVPAPELTAEEAATVARFEAAPYPPEVFAEIDGEIARRLARQSALGSCAGAAS
jgi:hypothetical protein